MSGTHEQDQAQSLDDLANLSEAELEALLIEAAYSFPASSVAELQALFPVPDGRKFHYGPDRRVEGLSFRLPRDEEDVCRSAAAELGHSLSSFIRESLKLAVALIQPYRLVPAWQHAAELHGRHSPQARAIETAFDAIMAETVPPPPWRTGGDNRDPET